jgi:pyruvate,water dikinase
MRYILFPKEADAHSPIGGKARTLAKLGRAGLPVPPWFALTYDAYHAGINGSLSPAVQGELMQALEELCPHGEPVAVRSSAADEDGARHSLAGQLDSFLFVARADVAEKASAVWRSAFGERVTAYRREHGLPPSVPGVLVQVMIDADAAGVAFGADPVSARRGLTVVSAVSGLGTGLVSGEKNADTWHVDRDGRIMADQPGTGARALDDVQVRQVAALARRAGRVLGRPQDIEWAIAKGRLYLLQSRPITALAGRADPDGVTQLWDNSNIAESYSGITTPLTFSFARRAYEEVYRRFCRLLRVPESKLAKNDDIFPRMLGLIRGRVYYNLLSWYRALALLPGFTINRRFMEQMMGVKTGLPDEVAAALAAAGRLERLRDGWYFLRSVAALAVNHFTLGRRIRRFYRRLDDALGTTRPDLSGLRADELAAYYRDLDRRLLPNWDAPLVNDFLAMIFFGLLRRLAQKWCGDADGALANDLVGGAGGMISAEPAARVRQLAEIARATPGLPEMLASGEPADARCAVEKAPALRDAVAAYIERFGDRCMEELKLESLTLHDDPLPLLRCIGQIAHRAATPEPPAQERADRDADAVVRQRLRWRPLRRLLFGWILRNARCRVRDRENLRFERTRLFGRARQIFLEFGRRLYELDALDDPRDVFYLEVAEILGFVDGTVTCTDLRSLARLRRAEFDRYRALPPPADRFETRGAVHQGNDFASATTAQTPTGETRQGIGGCPGVVRGPVRIVNDPRITAALPGEILVAMRTDPGWVLLFAAAAGLIVERGSLLSHSAIVARELKLPMVLNVDRVTSWLCDGDHVELDGGAGTVTRLEVAADGE